VDTIRRCFDEAGVHGSAIPVVPLKDSIRQVAGERNAAVPREQLRAVQTPQCFDLALLQPAFEVDYRSEFTDDASVMEHAGHGIHLCEGDPWNVKVTTPEDLVITRAFLRDSGATSL